ncbi:MAG TPA: hypothetical protein VKR56_01370 [Candidatus Cybelea sp.]|nr:hypothetical protein [Candidatus Cybelea sp.]
MQPPIAGTRSIEQTARAGDLLYASSIGNYCPVYVFTYPRGKLVQTLDACSFGFGPAFGLCTDKDGNVFMAMGEGFSILEFAHGGSEPIAELQDGSTAPTGCSVDPKTGDLGVASETGEVAIFKNASGTPENYSLQGIVGFFFCTFDDRGNLFADGEHEDGSFALAELPKGAAALREITVPRTFGLAFALQWDGRHIVIGGTQSSKEFTLDRIHLSGSSAKVVGTTTIDAASNASEPFQFWISNGTVIQPENGNAEIGFWNYPKGGNQTKGIKIGYSLVGITVSASRYRRR